MKIFLGRLDKERFIKSISLYKYENAGLPVKGELICIDDEIYEIINVLHDYSEDELSLFVKYYIWPNEEI